MGLSNSADQEWRHNLLRPHVVMAGQWNQSNYYN